MVWKREGASPARALDVACRRRRCRGQSLVEAALVLPFLITLAIGVADLGRAFSYRETVTNAARDASHVAELSAQQASGNDACKGLDGAVVSGSQATATAHIPAQTGDASLISLGGAGSGRPILLAVALESSSDGTWQGSVLNNSSTPTTVTVTWNCVSGAAVSFATATTVDPNSTTNGSATIEITVDYRFSLITPLAGGVMAPHIQATLYGRAQY